MSALTAIQKVTLKNALANEGIGEAIADIIDAKFESVGGTVSGATTFSAAVTLASSALSTAPTGGGLGYGTGAGGAVTQITSRATGVTLSKLTGAITTDSTSLAAEASAVFTVTNTTVAATDTIVLSIKSGMVGLNTRVTVTAVAAGSFDITVVNGNAAGGTAETGAIVINFAVLKAVAA